MDPVTGLWLLVPFFFLVALLYTSGGFGGGSSYTALLSFTGLGGQSIALASLGCNAAAVMSGFSGKGMSRDRLPAGPVLLMLSLSPVFSMLGSVVPLSDSQFRFAAGLMLIWAAASLALTQRRRQGGKPGRRQQGKDRILDDTGLQPDLREGFVLVTAGAAAAFLAGITGIGGGIYLAPILLRIKSLQASEVARISSMFILFNSLAGLGSRLLMSAMAGRRAGFGQLLQGANLLWYGALLAAVIAGGRIGGRLRRGENGRRIIAYTISLLMAFAGGLGVLGSLG